ncbi:MAG: twin-arginine translocase subunit TatC [Sphingobacteriales bacterium]|nr:MAG: twin-arginine translocase subunit TatC [Sphingobacteriales bacterium]
MRYTLDQPQEDPEMTFLDHLEALRWHIIRALVAVILFSVLAFANKSFIFDTVFLGPYNLNFWTYRQLCWLSTHFNLGDSVCVKTMGFKLINTEMAGQFTQHINMSISIGFVLAFPYALYEIWRFFKPALNSFERNYTKGVVGFSSILFLLGILFGYYIISPITIQFLGNYNLSSQIENTIQISDYISTLIMTTFSIALVFELPVIVFFLSQAGIFTPKGMREYRKHAILIILIISAILTPSSDVLSLLLVSFPFWILYELSILVSAFVYRKKLKKENT